MKTKPFRLLMMATALFSIALIAACSDDGGDEPAKNRADLLAKIEEAESLLANTEEGTIEDQYQVGSQVILQAAIDAAQEIYTNPKATQQQVNSATANLQRALDAYDDKKVAPIAAVNLVGRWKFDEGSGTTAFDDSDNKFDGTFKSGHATWGAGTPQWTTDRHGNPGKAISFDKGANIEVPYNTALNPQRISVSVWLNAREIHESNRFMGLHSWLGYKFQLQTTNRPFFSINTDQGVREEDATVELPINNWYHVVVTFDGETLKFYIDGQWVVTWDKPGLGKSISAKPYNLVFGQDFPTDKYAATDANFDNDQIIPLDWGGYFRGSLDEIRIYNIALTGGQVESIYNNEKPVEVN